MECYRKWRWVSKEGLVRYRRCGEAEAHHRYHGDRTLFTSERPLICATSQRGFKYSHSSLFHCTCFSHHNITTKWRLQQLPTPLTASTTVTVRHPLMFYPLYHWKLTDIATSAPRLQR